MAYQFGKQIPLVGYVPLVEKHCFTCHVLLLIYFSYIMLYSACYKVKHDHDLSFPSLFHCTKVETSFN
jgi:hypothetical protein